ncbi:hypothetical protein B0H34DRAFT_401968 [Crassisporium funariophilum]|nr:hypothetical protein B0H34DRAFT_401968 [Crassisporium funariophilum]
MPHWKHRFVLRYVFAASLKSPAFGLTSWLLVSFPYILSGKLPCSAGFWPLSMSSHGRIVCPLQFFHSQFRGPETKLGLFLTQDKFSQRKTSLFCGLWALSMTSHGRIVFPRSSFFGRFRLGSS